MYEGLALYIITGFLAGFCHSLILARGWKDLRSFGTFRRVVVAAIAGFVWFFMHSEWTFPNTVACFFFSWWGSEFLQRLAERVKPRVA